MIDREKQEEQTEKGSFIDDEEKRLKTSSRREDCQVDRIKKQSEQKGLDYELEEEKEEEKFTQRKQRESESDLEIYI